MRMNLLIIGNGFDLAHGLKTTYEDFLNWTYCENRMKKYGGFDLEGFWNIKNLNESEIFLYSAKYKLYIPKFAVRLFTRYNNWIDLENNISSIIEDGLFYQVNNYNDIDILKGVLDNYIYPEFECYIDKVINKTECEKQFDIQNANRVLSFNYSNTLERIYQTEVETCYVNGKASTDTTESHIVFGYDPSDENGSEGWCAYDKVHQRAYKNTDTKYKEWLRDENEYDIHIVGHSLGQTDSAFLEPFIMKKNSKTIVYYHNLESKRRLIYNMMGIVGRRSVDQENIVFKPLDMFKMNEYTPKVTVIPQKRRGHTI